MRSGEPNRDKRDAMKRKEEKERMQSWGETSEEETPSEEEERNEEVEQ